jgi:hypothetical protein
MSHFLTNGILGREHGYLIPVTTEDPCLKAVLDDFSEEFRVNIYVGDSYIDSVTMKNCKQVCNDVSSIPVVDRFGVQLGNIWSLVNEQMYYDYLKIHKSL